MKNANVYLICRSKERGEAALKQLLEETKSEKVYLILGEMGEKQELTRIYEEIKERMPRVDFFVHNAGCMIHKLEYTKDGIQKNYATNTFSVYYLTKLCLPLMHEASRTIAVSSGGMYTQKLVNKDIYMTKDFDGTAQYARNKRQQVCMMEQFARRYKEKGLFVSMHPGWVDTPAVRTSMPDFYNKMKDDLKKQEDGADTINYLLIEEHNKIENGGFYFDRKSEDKHLTISGTGYDQKGINNMMENLEKLAGF